MAQETLSNLFTPGFSKRIILQGVKELDIEIEPQIQNNDEQMHKYWLPNGIADAWLQNKNYHKLLIELDISSYTCFDAIEMIDNGIQREQQKIGAKSEAIFIEIDKDQEINTDNDSPWFSKTIAINLWRSTRLKNREIAFKLVLKEALVKKYIDEYKKAVRNQIKTNRLKAEKKKVVISSDKIEEIKSFWKRKTGKVINIEDVKKGVWGTKDEHWRPWNSTIASTMKKKLKMSYKVLNNQHSKVNLDDHKALYYQLILIQFLMKNYSFELIYVDEFSVSGRN